MKMQPAKSTIPTYASLSSFINTTRQLLLKQQKCQIQLFTNLTLQKSLTQIQDQGYGLSNMLIIGQRQGFYGKIVLTLIKNYHSEKNPILIPQECKMQVGDNVKLMKGNNFIAEGIVYKRQGAKIKISIRENQQEHHDYEGINCTVLLSWNQVTFKRYFNILQELQQYTIHKSSPIINRLFPQAHQIAKRDFIKKPTQLIDLPLMNVQQVVAIQTGLSQQVHLIHGPPGTGKTTTICQLIIQAVKKGEKVLACAPSNIAVDNMVQALGKKVKCVRVGNPARVIQQVVKRCLDFLITQHTNLWKNQVKKLKATRKRIKNATDRAEKKKLYFEIKQFQSEIHLLQQQTIQEILNEADVICCTNVGAADRIFKKYLSKRTFDLVVIDECGQGLQISCWIPLLKGRRAVLAGDHKQLPPTIKGIQNSLLSLTLFSRAMDQLRNVSSTMLLTQYRMNSLIMGWSNQQFYENKLIAHSSVKDHLLQQLYQKVDEQQEVIMMIDTTGCKMGESGQQGESKSNVGQADIAISVYKKVLSYGVLSKHVAILTPYSKQVAFIRAMIVAQQLPPVDVSTVDGIQGREKECIIISLVRSNKQKEIGFLKDWRRMNVAVTRARRMLIIIGNADCVSVDQNIKSLVKWIDEHGKIVSAFEFRQDSMVRFGEGVQDQQDFANNIPTNADKQKQKDKKKKKDKNKNKKAEIQKLNQPQKPSIYQAHTVDQIQSLKQYYRRIIKDVSDQKIFPGATNFQRKLIHQIAQQLNFHHQTSQDKKQIRVWIKQVQIKQQEIPQQNKIIQVKLKNRNRLFLTKEDIQNQKLIQEMQSKTQKKYLSNGNFAQGLQNLIGDQSQDQQIQQKPVEKQQIKQQIKQQDKIDQNKPKTRKRNKKGKNNAQENQQDWQKLLNQFQQSQPKKDQCYKCLKKITSVTTVNCRFCTLSFCRSHVLAQQHGCDQKAKNQARSNQRQVDKLVQKGAQKIKQKIKQQQQARKRKPKNEKNDKKQ